MKIFSTRRLSNLFLEGVIRNDGAIMMGGIRGDIGDGGGREVTQPHIMAKRSTETLD
jgi:hypothetical protein